MGVSLKKLFMYAWTSPVTLLGLAYVLAFQAAGWYKWQGASEDALVWQVDKKASPEWLKQYWQRWGGHAIGNVIVLGQSPEECPAIFVHEVQHVKQYMRMGILHPVFYALNYLMIKLCLKNSDPYFDNPAEIDARRGAHQVIDVKGAVKKIKSTKAADKQ